ncbi:MAG: hypothetical protein KJ060_10825 [Candidatus Hydrogenedentes bacterium]|nr:hypothetical protein [Candidatus Hydrogenedentota bacterium]
METRNVRWMFALVMALVSMAGCGSSNSGDSAGPAEPVVEVTTGDEARVPDQFPSDIPLPGGLTVINVSALPDQGTYVLQGQVPEALESVSDAMKVAIEEQGWKEETPAQAQELPDMKMMNFKKDGKMLNVTLFREDAGTSVNLTTSPG